MAALAALPARLPDAEPITGKLAWAVGKRKDIVKKNNPFCRIDTGMTKHAMKTTKSTNGPKQRRIDSRVSDQKLEF